MTTTIDMRPGTTVASRPSPGDRPHPDRTVRSGIRPPNPIRRQAARLLAQQFWLFGCDIRRGDGNLLLQFGFEKCRPPAGSRVTASRYTCVYPSGRGIILWGFGMYWRDPGLGGVYLPRTAFDPMIRMSTAIPDAAWDPGHIDGLVRPVTVCEVDRSRHLLADALAWIRDYEVAVADLVGTSYREHAVATWKRPCGRAADLPRQWQTVIDALSASPADAPTKRRSQLPALP